MQPSLSIHLAAIEKMKAFIGTLQKERSNRPGHGYFVGDPDGLVHSCWHIYEMERLLLRVNTLRAQCGFGTITLDDLRRVERMAVGHSDYTHKLALYATELAEGIQPIP